MNLTRTRVALIALLLGMVLVAVVGSLPLSEEMASLLFDKPRSGGGSFFPYPFTIQNLMWLVFFLGLGELFTRVQLIRSCERALQASYLPEGEDVILTHRDMGRLYRAIRTASGEPARLIRSLVLRFQASQSVEQTHEMLNSQLEMWQYRVENDYTMIRYLSWLIPTLGFIGTVVGIAFTLNWAGSGQIAPDAPEFLPNLTERLGVAFYTTLLALVFSAILVFLTHLAQGREERAIAGTGQYCLDNLITRLYVD